MSTYYQIFGGKINVVSADPSNPIEGQTWYNTTTEVLKYRTATLTGSWSTGGNLATARTRLGGAGTQTAGLGFGGTTGVKQNTTEEYDGTSWTGGGNLGTARYQLAGAGTQTLGLGFGGYTAPPASPSAAARSNATEE
jgi:hypothetical protein